MSNKQAINTSDTDKEFAAGDPLKFVISTFA